MTTRSLTLAIALTSFALSGCNLGLSGKKIEENIKEGLEKKDVDVKSIECPKNEKNEDGNEFTCEGKASNGTEFEIEVEAKGGGGIEWKLVGMIQDTHKLEKELKKKLGHDYDCGSDGETIIANEGVEVVCKSDVDKHTITFTDDEGEHEIDSKKR